MATPKEMILTNLRIFWYQLTAGSDQQYFFENLYMLLGAGIDVGTALSTLERAVKTQAMKATIRAVLADIDAGESLSKAFGRQNLLPESMISLVRIGEKSGRLSENLRVIVNQMDKDRELRGKLVSATLYPAFVMGLTILVGLSIAWFLLPNLATVFGQLNIELPLITQILVGFGAFLATWGIVVIPLTIIGLITLVIMLVFYDPVRQAGLTMLFSVPGFHELMADVEMARFGYILGSLLSVGIPFTDSLDQLVITTTFGNYRRFYAHVRDRVVEGKPFGKSIAGYSRSEDYIPAPIQQLIMSAEESGQLAPTLIHIGEISEAKTESSTKNITTLLEPVLLVIVWLGVLWVAVAVILPLYSLIGGINNATP